MTTLERLLAALTRDPKLEYAVWERMRTVRYYQPWREEGQGSRSFILVGLVNPSVVARVEQGLTHWEGVCGPGRFIGDTREEVTSRVEAVLWADNWKEVPRV